jgi:hypothetical protein
MKLQQEKEQKTFIRAILLFGIGTIILFGCVLYFDSLLAEKVQNRKDFLAETEKQIASFQKSADFLSSNDLDLLAKTFTDRIFWAKKLVALSQEIDNKMAITQFSYKNGILSLYGVTSIDKNQREFDLIDQFIAKLKANPQISMDFPEIKYARASRDKVKDTDIIRFQIDCISDDFLNRKGGAK